MKRPTTLISKLKYCFNGEFQDVCDYILFVENLNKIKTIDEFAKRLNLKFIELPLDNLIILDILKEVNEVAEQMKEQK